MMFIAEHHMEMLMNAPNATNAPAEAAGAKTDTKKSSDPKKLTKARPEPQEQLPTDRIAFDKQLKFLLAYAAASDNGAKAVSNEDVAGLVEMNASTVSLANAFFVKMGFLARSGREYTPAKEVLEFKLADEWDPEGAPAKLAPLVERSWFAQALRPKLQMRPVDEVEAISDLAQRAMVTPDYKPQLKMLLNYLTRTGLVRQDGDKLTWIRKGHDTSESKPTPPTEKPRPSFGGGSHAEQPPIGGQGGINFSVNIAVSAADIGRWSPERIQAFFSGLAAVLAAKAGMEDKK